MNLWLAARGRQLALISLLGIVLTGFIGLNSMGFFSSNKQELKHLLADAGAVLIDEAEVVDGNPILITSHAPTTWYARWMKNAIVNWPSS